MTNEEAIKQIQERIDIANKWYADVDLKDYVDALTMAIEALKAQDVTDTNVGNKKVKNSNQELKNQNDLISRQAVIDALEKVAELFPYKVPGKGGTYDKYNEAWNDAIGRAEIEIEKLPSVQPEPIWHECFEDDPTSFPGDDRNVLVSFSNFSLSIIGQWRVDADGAGCWYLGDTDETFLSEDLYVDGWWELPKKPERR